MLSPELMKKIRRIEIRTRRLVNDSFAGEYHSIFKGRGMEFDEVRPYQVGDEIRTIDWKTLGRCSASNVSWPQNLPPCWLSRQRPTMIGLD